MRLGDGRGFLCDGCGSHMKYNEKFEICFRKYTYDETLPIVKSMTSSSVCAYDFCEECFEKAFKKLSSLNTVRPEHNPKQLLNKRYLKLVWKMREISRSRGN